MEEFLTITVPLVRELVTQQNKDKLIFKIHKFTSNDAIKHTQKHLRNLFLITIV